jgi:hypothetical protein
MIVLFLLLGIILFSGNIMPQKTTVPASGMMQASPSATP